MRLFRALLAGAVPLAGLFIGLFVDKYIMPFLPKNPTWIVWILLILSLIVIVVAFFWNTVKKLFGISEKDKDSVPIRDFPAWDVLQYILNETDFGRDKKEHEIIFALRQAAADGRITVWACKDAGKAHLIIPKETFGEHTFQLEPGGSGGMIQKDGGWLTGGDVYYEPMFSRQEIEKEFGKQQKEK